MLTLSERVKEAVRSAREKGHSVSDIAKACNIKVQAVYAWASGDSKSIDGNNLVELAELSGYRPMWIMKGNQPSKTPIPETKNNVIKVWFQSSFDF